jgi:hypothetical protein
VKSVSEATLSLKRRVQYYEWSCFDLSTNHIQSTVLRHDLDTNPIEHLYKSKVATTALGVPPNSSLQGDSSVHLLVASLSLGTKRTHYVLKARRDTLAHAYKLIHNYYWSSSDSLQIIIYIYP